MRGYAVNVFNMGVVEVKYRSKHSVARKLNQREEKMWHNPIHHCDHFAKEFGVDGATTIIVVHIAGIDRVCSTCGQVVARKLNQEEVKP